MGPLDPKGEAVSKPNTSTRPFRVEKILESGGLVYVFVAFSFHEFLVSPKTLNLNNSQP